MLDPWLTLLRIFPGNCLSLVFGRFAGIHFPDILLQPLLRWYVKKYGANLSESARQLEQFSSLAEFFVRDLRVGVRPLSSGVVSPVDGRLVGIGRIPGREIPQIKGWTYKVSELIGEEGSPYETGSYATVYLAPGDYHHIHIPVNGEVVALRYIPGALWPVNSWSVNRVPQLFCRNERVVIELTSAYGRMALVCVGATNVGSISVAFDDVVSNQQCSFSRNKEILVRKYSQPFAFNRGEKIATFNLGSTVVLLSENPELFAASAGFDARKIRLGETLADESMSRR
ncbi:MAG: archaetidylserine decarboxylase [bacterium]|nr:archaetidylserine decarboxylase [bacterium]